MTELLIKLPSATYQRVWANPAASRNNLIVLTASHMHIGTWPTINLFTELTRLREGGKVGSLGGNAIHIELMGVTSATLDLHTNELRVEVAKGLGTTIVRIPMADAASADEAFRELHRQLGSGFVVRPTRPDAATALKWPLIALVVIAVATTLLALGASILEQLAAVHAAGPVAIDTPLGKHELSLPQSPTEVLGHYIRGQIKAWQIVTFGLIVASGAIVWGVIRLNKPPASVSIYRPV